MPWVHACSQAGVFWGACHPICGDPGLPFVAYCCLHGGTALYTAVLAQGAQSILCWTLVGAVENKRATAGNTKAK